MERLERTDKKYIWHPFTQMQDWLSLKPLIVEEARGCYLKDSFGEWYLDGVSSLWVNIHGHRKKEIDSAIKRQVGKLSHSTMLGLSNKPAIELAKKLIEIAPIGLNKVFYSDNGSTSVEIALKMAYQYWQNIGKSKKRKFIYLENSYHGDTLGAVSVGGIDLFHKVYRPLLFNAIKINTPYIKNLEKILKQKNKAIAALIVEPIVQGAGGMLVWPKGVLRKMRELCNKYDVLLICDEVATGFGRTGKMFACEHENVVPDIMCVSKGITGGYLPLAATLVKDKIYNAFLADYKDMKAFFHGHSYTGNPLACAAAIANLEIFKKERTLEKLQPKIKYLTQGLKRFCSLKHVVEIRQKGFMVGIELGPYNWEDKIGIKVCERARKYGLILRPLGNVIVFMPPLAISKKELKALLDITFRAIKEIT